MARKNGVKKRKVNQKTQKMMARKKRLAENKALAEEYGLKMSYWRYQGKKGIYWALFSEYIRKRDLLKYGTCISCGKGFIEIKEVQGGHYAPAGNCGFKLLFDEMNVHAECPKCNNPLFSPGKLIHYRANLVKRYGEKRIKKLDEEYRRKDTMKQWTSLEFDVEIKKLQGKIEKLNEEISKRLRGS